MERVRRKPTENLKAYDYYLRALFVAYQQTRKGNVEALRLTKIAISLDLRSPGPTLLQQVILDRRKRGRGQGMLPKSGLKPGSLPNERYSSTRMILWCLRCQDKRTHTYSKSRRKGKLFVQAPLPSIPIRFWRAIGKAGQIFISEMTTLRLSSFRRQFA
ncbi:hypothetical protein CWO90_21800 [Bradyrhizobium sp. Leo121]|nr:hypothetical protein CWO90_21800 [Bradyrhizobium sp. Leo121]